MEIHIAPLLITVFKMADDIITAALKLFPPSFDWAEEALKEDEYWSSMPSLNTGPARAVPTFNEKTKIPRESWMVIPRVKCLKDICEKFPVYYREIEPHTFAKNGKTYDAKQYAIYWMPKHICENWRCKEDDHEIVMEYYAYTSHVLCISLSESLAWTFERNTDDVYAMDHSDVIPIAIIRMNFTINDSSPALAFASADTVTEDDDFTFASKMLANNPKLAKPSVAAAAKAVLADMPSPEIMAQVPKIGKISDVCFIYPIVWVKCPDPHNEIYSIRIHIKKCSDNGLNISTVRKHLVYFLRACNTRWRVEIIPEIGGSEICRIYVL